ncbi:Nuclear pore complex protein NUP1-like protein, partial [Drosera capensis]
MAAAAYDGGAGGKFRKKRHQATTPYDWPPTTSGGGLRITQRNGSSGWLSRIVDPASKVIAAGANRLFASVFRKRLLGPPGMQGQQQQRKYSAANEEIRDRKLVVASNEVNHLGEEQAGYDKSLRASTNGDGIAELEKLLRQKNLTRQMLILWTSLPYVLVHGSACLAALTLRILVLSARRLRGSPIMSFYVDCSSKQALACVIYTEQVREQANCMVQIILSFKLKAVGFYIMFGNLLGSFHACLTCFRGDLSELEHLTALLHSRRTENLIGVIKERSEATHEENHASHSEDFGTINGPVLDNGFKHKVLEEEMASPVDLAKAYMASRSGRVSPSIPGSQIRSRAEDPPFSSSHFQLRSPGISIASKPLSTFSNHENSFEMSRSRGKSAIYSMSHPSYSRSQPILLYKGSGTAIEAGPSSSSLLQNAPDNSQFNEPKKSVLKRRSSVLDNDIGPIRRIRQKPNLIASRSIALPFSGNSHTAWGPEVASAVIPLPMVQSRDGPSSSNSVAVGMDEKMNQNSKYTPSKSIEMGHRILQQLDKISPKETPKGRNLSIAAGKSPMKLTPDMLHGQARRSLETLDSSKLLQTVQLNNGKSGASNGVTDISIPTSKKVDDVSENSSKGPTISLRQVAPGISSEARPSNKAPLNTLVAKDTAAIKFDGFPKMRRTFKMSAPEDFDLEDDVHSNGNVSVSLNEWKKDDTNVSSEVLTSKRKVLDVPNAPVLDEVVSVPKNPLILEPTPPSAAESKQNKEPEHKDDKASAAENTSDFKFSTAPVSSPAFSVTGKSTVVSRTSGSSEAFLAQHSNTAGPAFGLPPKSSDMMPPSSLSAPSLPSEFSDSKDTQTVLSASIAPVTSSPGAAPTFPLPDKNENKDALKVSGEEKIVRSSSATGLAASSFSFTVPIGSPTVSNGSVGSGSKTMSGVSPVLFSNDSTKQSFSNGFTQSATATVADGVATTAAIAINDASPKVAVSSNSLSITSSTHSMDASTFKFGTAESPAASASQVSAVSGTESTEPGFKPKETGFGSQSIIPSSFPSSVTSGEGTGLFGFNASASANVALSTPLLNPLSSRSVSGSTSVESSSTTAAMSSSSLKSSETPLFASTVDSALPVFTFGAMNSVSAPATSNVSGSTAVESSSTSAAMTSGSWQSTSSSLFTSTTNSAPSPFSFEATGSASSSANSNASMAFTTTGSSSSPIFSFAAAPPVAPSQPSIGSTNSVFSFGLNPSSNNNDQINMDDSMAEDSVTASAPAVPAFGQSPMAAAPSTGLMFGATPPPTSNPFQFGAQPTPFSTTNPFQFGGQQTPSPTTNPFQFGGQPTPSVTTNPFQFGGQPAPSPAANPFQFGGQPSHQVPTQNVSPFQPSGSLEATPGSFSLGATGGNDKSGRRVIKVRKQLPNGGGTQKCWVSNSFLMEEEPRNVQAVRLCLYRGRVEK